MKTVRLKDVLKINIIHFLSAKRMQGCSLYVRLLFSKCISFIFGQMIRRDKLSLFVLSSIVCRQWSQKNNKLELLNQEPISFLSCLMQRLSSTTINKVLLYYLVHYRYVSPMKRYSSYKNLFSFSWSLENFPKEG